MIPVPGLWAVSGRMRVPPILLAIFLPLLWSACSDSKSPPVEPEPSPVVIPLVESSQTQDGVVLTLTVDLVLWKGDSTLTLGAKVENSNDHAIQYDPGGCGCPNPSSFMESANGGLCFCLGYVRRMCPCSGGNVIELPPGGVIGTGDQFPGDCLDNCSEAVAGFAYQVNVNGEQVFRGLKVTWPGS